MIKEKNDQPGRSIRLGSIWSKGEWGGESYLPLQVYLIGLRLEVTLTMFLFWKIQRSVVHRKKITFLFSGCASNQPTIFSCPILTSGELLQLDTFQAWTLNFDMLLDVGRRFFHVWCYILNCKLQLFLMVNVALKAWSYTKIAITAYWKSAFKGRSRTTCRPSLVEVTFSEYLLLIK